MVSAVWITIYGGIFEFVTECVRIDFDEEHPTSWLGKQFLQHGTAGSLISIRLALVCLVLSSLAHTCHQSRLLLNLLDAGEKTFV